MGSLVAVGDGVSVSLKVAVGLAVAVAVGSGNVARAGVADERGVAQAVTTTASSSAAGKNIHFIGTLH
jgi:hypothetical protein